MPRSGLSASSSKANLMPTTKLSTGRAASRGDVYYRRRGAATARPRRTPSFLCDTERRGYQYCARGTISLLCNPDTDLGGLDMDLGLAGMDLGES
eukprot:1026427-Rhodomonas_salina.4